MSPVPGLPDSLWRPRTWWEDPNWRVAGGWRRPNGNIYRAPLANFANIDTAAQHYPGAGDSPADGDPTDRPLDQYARDIQRAYATDPNRGYSIGYNFLIDYRGIVVEARGFDFQCAANRDHNGHTVAIQYVVDNADALTPAAITSGRLVNREIARRASRPTDRPWSQGGLWLSGHNDLRRYPPLFGKGTATACCGSGIYSQLYFGGAPVGDGGLLHPRHITTPPPPPPQPPEDDDMPLFVVKNSNNPTGFHFGDRTTRRYITSQDVASSIIGRGNVVDWHTKKEITSVSQVTARPPGEWADGLGVPIEDTLAGHTATLANHTARLQRIEDKPTGGGGNVSGTFVGTVT